MSGPLLPPPDDDPELEAWIQRQLDEQVEQGKAQARGLLNEAMQRQALERALIDYSTAPRPRLRWFLMRRRHEHAWEDFERAYDVWYSAQREAAGLSPLPPPEHERLIDGIPIAPRDPAIDAAMRRIDQVSDRMPVQES